MGKGNGMRVRFASPPRTAKTQEKQPLPPAHDEALGAIRDARPRRRRPGAPDAVALQASPRLGRVAAGARSEPEEKRRRAAPPPSRRRRWRRRRGPRGGPAGERAWRRLRPWAAARSYPADPVAFCATAALECRSAAAGRRQGPAQRPAGGRALTRHARRPPSPSACGERAPPRASFGTRPSRRARPKRRWTRKWRRRRRLPPTSLYRP